MGISKRKRRSGEMHLQLCVHPSLSAFMSGRLPNTLQDIYCPTDCNWKFLFHVISFTEHCTHEHLTSSAFYSKCVTSHSCFFVFAGMNRCCGTAPVNILWADMDRNGGWKLGMEYDIL